MAVQSVGVLIGGPVVHRAYLERSAAGNSMGNWKKRLREVASRNPESLPGWLSGGTPDAAWYRVSWQIDEGVDPEAAARPAVILLNWLARRGLLNRNGNAALVAIRENQTRNLSISRSMVNSKCAVFLDQIWETWWLSHGINLVISENHGEAASAAIEEAWAAYGLKKSGQ